MIVLLVKQTATDDEKPFVELVARMNSTQPDSSRLFGIINLEDDVQKSLGKYNFGSNPAIKIITKKSVYSFDGSTDNF